MLSLLKPLKSLLEIGYLLFDSAQLCLVLYSAQVVLSKFLSDVVLKLTSQDPEIGIAPYRTFAVLQCAGLDAVDNEVPAHAVFRLGRDVAQRRSLAIPFTVCRHDVLFPPHTPYRGHGQACPCRVEASHIMVLIGYVHPGLRTWSTASCHGLLPASLARIALMCST